MHEDGFPVFPVSVLVQCHKRACVQVRIYISVAHIFFTMAGGEDNQIVVAAEGNAGQMVPGLQPAPCPATVPLRLKFFSRNPIYTSAPPPRFWPEPPWHMLVPYDGPPPLKIPIPFMDPVVREMAIRAAWVMVHCPPEEFEWDELGYHRITQPWQ